MANQITTSKQYSINWRDIAKGLVVATLTPCLVIIQTTLDEGSLVFHWKQIGMAGIAGLVAYLLKNYFTPSQIVITPTTGTIPAAATAVAEVVNTATKQTS